MAEAGATLLDRTLRRLRRGWHELSLSGPRSLADTLSRKLDGADLARVRSAVTDCLEGRGGEVSALSRAAALGEAYLILDATGRGRFLNLLATEFGCDRTQVDAAAQALLSARDGDRAGAERALRMALSPPRFALFRQLGALPQGVKFLVELRAELERLSLDEDVRRSLSEELRDLLSSWFDYGFLELRRITWASPADLLERLMAYEAVHEIRSWTDLKNRLDSDRRCFAFFHPRMPGEPLIFIEVALTSGLADSVEALLDETAAATDPAQADTAIFYSISNAQRGLAGISFGGFLIKRVVDLLRAEFPKLKTFATLSPMPEFRAWLADCVATAPKSIAALVSDDDIAVLRETLDRNWPANPEQVAALREPLVRLGAHYLLAEKRNGRASDPVAHFHLSNGARVERLNFLADRSPKGMRESAGLMVNYLYKLDEIEANHEAYGAEGKIRASSQLRGLAKGS